MACIADVWAEIGARARALPRFRELADVLAYDYDQLFNTMRYAVLINRHTEDPEPGRERAVPAAQHAHDGEFDGRLDGLALL